MDGSSIWAISLWRAPQGANLRHSIPLSEEYIQCAGTAEAMTVEVRVVSGDVFHAYFLSDDVPSTYSLRERNLNWPTSELTKP